MIGKTISHYQILNVLGRGAMSTVYKARDLKLERHVALKFLAAQLTVDESEKLRLIQEAKTTSALEHPNICTIYEIGEMSDGQVFIAMAFYEGETLADRIARGPMSVEESLNIITQIARGLAKAHEKWIIHRDLKPANIIITTDDVIKILDFGIAKLMSGKGKTRSGMIMGTPGYMAPEQARAGSIGPYTDMWSLGVILYEMLSGELPFSGDNELALIYSIVNEPPTPISHYVDNLPPNIERLIEKTLQKNAHDRIRNVDEFMRTLEEQGGGAEQETIRMAPVEIDTSPSIAVLPFKDMSPDGDQEYFGDGLAEEVISTLSRLEGLRVISRMSSFQFKGKESQLREIGQQLKVKSVLEGSIRKAGNKVRISAQLVNAADGFLLWSEQYEREMQDIFEIQDEIAQAIVKALKIKLIGEQQKALYKNYTDNIEAYSEYLKGRYQWNKRTAESLKKSIEHFDQAIEKDPRYALAYAGLADVYIIMGLYGSLPPQFVMPKAKASAQKALEIDPDLAEAHTSLGCIQSVYGWDWEGAEEQFQLGIDLNPNYALAHHWYSINYLTPQGRFSEAISEIQKALDLDPISLAINATVGLVYYFAREYDAAVDCFLKTLEVEPNFAMAHFFLGQTHIQRKMFDEALSRFEEANKLFGGSTNMQATYATAAALAGDKEKAREILDSLTDVSNEKYVSAYDMAMIHTGLGDEKMAFKWLEKALDEHSYLLIYLNVDPLLDPLRGDKRFISIKQKMGFPE